MTGKNYFFSMLFFAIALLGSLLAPTAGNAQAICTNTTIINFLPTSGPEGTVVTINGAGFSLGSGTTAVQFNGVSAAFTAVSDTQLRATVPAGNTTGTITVITNGCRSVRSGFTLLTTSCTPQDIYISELYDRNGGSYGIIELYNPSATTPVVMNGQYVLERYGNIGDASPSSGYSLILSGTINPQDTYIVSSYNSGANGCPDLPIDENMGNGINENDQIKLLRDGRVIDVANAPDEVGYSVVRKPNVTAPKVAQSNSDWDFYSNERCDNLGWHDPGTAVPSTPPTFTVQPANVTVCEGQTATFSVTLSSTTGATYQWKTVNTSGAWTNVSGSGFSGATTRTLTVTATAALNNTQYYCVVTTPTCTLVSNAALLTVSRAPQATYVVTNASCATNTGTITMTPVSGNGLTYSLDGGTYQTETLFTGVAVGSHTVTVKNAEGCLATISGIVITAPVLPTLATATLIQPDCTNANGTITVTAPLSADFEYSIDGTTFQSGLVFNVSTAGSYTITVRNTITGCTSVSLPFVINAVPNAPAQATATLIQPDCTNANGTITVTAPLSADYEYSIDGTTFQSGLVFNVSTAGSYTITVRNTITGCTSVSLPFVINAVPNAPAQATATLIQPDCTNANGTITVTAPLSTDYEYSIDGTTFQSGLVFNVSTSGSYTITVRNTITGCTSVSLPFVINAVTAAPAQATATLVQPDCTNANGTITVTAPLSADFEYSIDGTTFQSGLVFNISTAGSYTITVRNTISGCTSVSLPFVINAVPNAPAQATATLIQPDCTNANGTITVTAPLSADYEYSIDGTTFQSGLTFNVSTAGSYTITVRNTITGCTSVSLPFVINAVPNAPAQATATLIQPDCTNSNGTITVTAPLSADYEYSIDGTTFQSGLVFNVSTAGSYTITTRNTITGCTSVSLPFVINAVPNAPAQATATSIQPDCTNANGTITVTAPLSTDYEYSIDGTTFQSGLVFNVSTSGSYTITVRNTITGCTSVSLPFVINAVPSAPAQATATLVQPDCANANGAITVTAPISADFEYSIDGTTFQSGLVFNVSTAGSYTITVRNTITGCTSVSLPFVINAVPNAPAQATATLVQPDCANANGTITVTAPLSTDYEYSIDGTTFQSGLVFTVSTAGSYNITVRNTITGCTSVSLPFVINAPLSGLPQLTGAQGCVPGINGSSYMLEGLALNNSFNIADVTFEWRLAGETAVIGNDATFNATEYKNNNGLTSQDFPLQFELTVTTNGGCTDTYIFTVESIVCDIPKGISPNNDNRNDSFDLSGMNVSHLTIVNRYGLEVYHRSNYRNEWHGQTDNDQDLPTGTYFYMVQLPDGTRTGWVYLNRETR